MESLQTSLQNCVKAAVDQFIDKLASELKLDKEKALALWNSSAGDDLKVVETSKKTVVCKKVPVEKKTKVSNSDEQKKTCQYTFVKGDKEGDVCGAKVSDESETGMYCKKHLGQEKKSDDKKVSTKKTSNSSSSNSSSVVGDTKSSATSKKPSKTTKPLESSDVTSKLQKDGPIFSVKKNKFGNYEHEVTGFLFDRKTEEVYGRQCSDGRILQLNIEDIEVCKSMGFKFRIPESLVSGADSGDTADDEEEIVDDEEEEEEEEEDDDDDGEN